MIGKQLHAIWSTLNEGGGGICESNSHLCKKLALSHNFCPRLWYAGGLEMTKNAIEKAMVSCHQFIQK